MADIDGKVREYMAGWCEAANESWNGDFCGPTDDEDLTKDWRAGFDAGRAAYLATERAERERLVYSKRKPALVKCGGYSRTGGTSR